jgi:hypothetical protein
MSNNVQKTEIPGIVKVGEGTLINTDNDALRAYKTRKEKERKVLRLEEDMSLLKNDLEEIKNLLKGLVK